MRTTVRATCDNGCGDVRTTIDKVVLRKAETADGVVYEYRFLCPQCNKIVLKHCDEAVANVLIAADVAVETFTQSIELLERPREEDAAAIGLDDILDLGLALQDDEQFMRMMEGWGKYDC